MRGRIKNALATYFGFPVSQKVLIALMILTVSSFFVQSALPRDVSSAESRAVAGFLSSIISYDTDIGKFIIDNIRKIGHFCEYGLFGLESALLISFYFEKKNRKKGAFGFLGFAFAIAFCDETVQIFSGRGPAISDVWIDGFGFSAVGLMTLLCVYLFRRFIKPSKENK